MIHGHKATKSVDFWALGCILFQMLSGRTPVWAEESEENSHVFQKIVKFSMERAFPDHFSAEAKDLINALMDKDPSKRLGAGPDGYTALKNHPFFAGFSFVDIHKRPAPEMSKGIVGPQKHKAWARRKFSMFSAPMPEAYNFDEKFKLEIIPEAEDENGKQKEEQEVPDEQKPGNTA